MALEAQKAPVSEVDPFCREFFEDPFCAHEELREAGPVVRLSRYDVWAVARYAEVHRVLNDWESFCSSRGVGLTDFAKEKPRRPEVPGAGDRPAIARQDAPGAQPCPLRLGYDATARALCAEGGRVDR